MELIKTKIKTDNYPAKLKTVCLMEGDIIVPDVKPDVGEIIKYSARGFLTDASVSGGKLNIKGRIKLSVLYNPKGDEKKLDSLRTELTLNDMIAEDGLEGSEPLIFGIEVSDCDISAVNDRKMKYRVVLDICFLKNSGEEFEIISDIKDIPQDQIKKNSFKRICETERGQETFRLSEEFSLPSDKPSISEICETDVSVRGLDVKLSGDKLSVSGEVSIYILYKSEEDEKVETLEYEIPLSGMLETKAKDKNAICSVSISIQEDKITADEDDDGEKRIVGCDIELAAAYRILTEEETEYLEDAYCAFKKTETETADTEYSVFVCRNKNQFPVKETVELDKNMPKIMRVYNVCCRAVCDNIEEYNDRAVVEGAVETKILYAAEDDERPVCCYETMLPYRQAIELKGLEPGDLMNVETELGIEHISWSMLDGREIEIKPIVSVCAEVTENKKISLISDLVFSELPPETINSIASMTLYIVRKGDTLWNIAKKYNTNIADIVRINHIENPDVIYPGEKLLIVKKTMP